MAGVVVFLLILLFASGFLGSTNDDYGDTIVEEVSSSLSLYNKLDSFRTAVGSAILFLEGSANIASSQENGESAIGGPNEEENLSELETVGGSALVASTPVLSIIPSGSVLSKEALTFTYEVEEGDNLSTIAEEFGVSLKTLLWANNLSSQTILRTGDRLTILPVDGVTHTIVRGDTISSIATKYKAEPEDILAFNRLGDDDIIKIGDVLVIPGGRPHVAISSSVTPSTPIHSLVNISGYFGVPAKGRITYGLHRYNAIDIGGREYCNTSVYASAAGTVITADRVGWNDGYGKYLKISHPNGTVTLYAHASELLVSQGQSVYKGQVIALMGSTGRATGCHVHFEVRGARNPLAQY